jgi:hypothetical protein
VRDGVRAERCVGAVDVTVGADVQRDGEAGWVVSDPTVINDGLLIPIGLGVVVLVVGGAFIAVNAGIGRWAGVPIGRWLSTAVATGVAVAAVTVIV